MKEAGLVLVSIVLFALAACGGKDKPPLTPDDTDNAMGADAGDMAAPATTAAPTK